MQVNWWLRGYYGVDFITFKLRQHGLDWSLAFAALISHNVYLLINEEYRIISKVRTVSLEKRR